MKVIAIGGLPATGKTMLVRQLLADYGKPIPQLKIGLTAGYYDKEADFFILGIYNDDIYSGTDKLSMAAQKEVQKFLAYLSQNRPNTTVLFEGDRLFNVKFFDFIKSQGAELHIFVLDARKQEIDFRHENRKDNQNEKFIKGRATKLDNIRQVHKVEILPNENLFDLKQNSEAILKLIKK